MHGERLPRSVHLNENHFHSGQFRDPLLDFSLSILLPMRVMNAFQSPQCIYLSSVNNRPHTKNDILKRDSKI